MIKTLLGQVKEFKLVSLLTPLGMLAEVIVENFIPLQMAVIIDSIGKNDLSTIYKTSVIMLLLALAGLIAGYMGGVWGAKASTGFARNLRKAMYENIQTFSFSNIDAARPLRAATPDAKTALPNGGHTPVIFRRSAKNAARTEGRIR